MKKRYNVLKVDLPQGIQTTACAIARAIDIFVVSHRQFLDLTKYRCISLRVSYLSLKGRHSKMKTVCWESPSFILVNIRLLLYSTVVSAFVVQFSHHRVVRYICQVAINIFSVSSEFMYVFLCLFIAGISSLCTSLIRYKFSRLKSFVLSWKIRFEWIQLAEWVYSMFTHSQPMFSKAFILTRLRFTSSATCATVS